MPQADTEKPERPDDDPAVAKEAPRVLALGISPALLERVREASGARFVAADYRDLDVQLLARVMPDIVLAPLLGRDFDVLDLAQRLSAMGYRGALHAVTAPLPDPDAVRREVTRQCDGIVFSLVVLDDRAAG